MHDVYFNHELLVEGCPHSNCEVIRAYSMATRAFSVAYENVKPHKICPGPPGSLLLCDWKIQSLLQLTPAAALNGNTDLKFLEVHRLRLNCRSIFGMDYIDQHRIVILTSKFKNKVQAVSLNSGDIIWKHNASVENILLNPENVSTTPNGWICLANGNKLLIQDPLDGSCRDVLLPAVLTCIKNVVWSGNKLAIRHETPPNKITCYSATFIRTEDLDRLRLTSNPVVPVYI